MIFASCQPQNWSVSHASKPTFEWQFRNETCRTTKANCWALVVDGLTHSIGLQWAGYLPVGESFESRGFLVWQITTASES